MTEYRRSLLYYTDLFQKLASMSSDLNEARSLVKAAGQVPDKPENLLSLAELDAILARPRDFPQKTKLHEIVARLRQYDADALRHSYIDTVYGIYNRGIPSPVDPRHSDAVNNLFNRFN